MAVATLNPKQERFAQGYVVDPNATQAAIRAGYSQKTAYSQGQRLLKHVEVQAAIQELRDKDAAKADISRERVLEEYRRIAFGDMRAVVEWAKASVSLTDSAELSTEQAAMVAEVSETVTGSSANIKVKFHSKLQALEGIRKVLGYDAPTRTENTDTSPDRQLLEEFTLQELLDFRDMRRKLVASREEEKVAVPR